MQDIEHSSKDPVLGETVLHLQQLHFTHGCQSGWTFKFYTVVDPNFDWLHAGSKKNTRAPCTLLYPGTPCSASSALLLALFKLNPSLLLEATVTTVLAPFTEIFSLLRCSATLWSHPHLLLI